MKKIKSKEEILKYIVLAIIYLLIILLIIVLINSNDKTTSKPNIDTDNTTTTTTTTMPTGIVTETLSKGSYEIEYSYERTSNNIYKNLKLSINNQTVDLNNYDISKEKYKNIDIKLLNDYIAIETTSENACKSKFYNLILINYNGKVIFTTNPKSNDIAFSPLKYAGEYIYNEETNLIELNYTLSCDTNCNICTSLDPKGNISKDIYSMTCEELDYVLNNVTGKISAKLSLEGENIIETMTQNEKLKDDLSGYNNNLKTKLNEFYQNKCSNS